MDMFVVCASGAICMLFIMSGTWCCSALLCRAGSVSCLVQSCYTMQLFMWQREIVGVAHYIMECFDVLGALDDAPDDASTSSALAAG